MFHHLRLLETSGMGGFGGRRLRWAPARHGSHKRWLYSPCILCMFCNSRTPMCDVVQCSNASVSLCFVLVLRIRKVKILFLFFPFMGVKSVQSSPSNSSSSSDSSSDSDFEPSQNHSQGVLQEIKRVQFFLS